MATIKSYTDLEQSKKLAEILPLESADMRYEYSPKERDAIQEPIIGFSISSMNYYKDSDLIRYLPCWSLTALLKVIPKKIKDFNVLRIDIDEKGFSIWYDEIGYGVNNDLPDITADNPVDACVAMIIRLNELNLL